MVAGKTTAGKIRGVLRMKLRLLQRIVPSIMQ
jgi:hypothetical protein